MDKTVDANVRNLLKKFGIEDEVTEIEEIESGITGIDWFYLLAHTKSSKYLIVANVALSEDSVDAAYAQDKGLGRISKLHYFDTDGTEITETNFGFMMSKVYKVSE